MTTLEELLHAHRRLTAVHVERWVARGLLRPTSAAGAWSFETVDVARACLLVELVDEMGLDDEALETVMDLLDQVHTLRYQVDLLGQAISQQPPSVRDSIAATLRLLGRR
jgi:chaperone modulatory protein CbpM